MNEKTILITGGDGRLATHLRNHGEADGHRVVCLDLDRMDVSDRESVERAVQEHSPDVLIHCAAVLDGDLMAGLLDTNILGTVNVVRICARHKAKLIYISTDHVYPMTEASHQEASPLLPFNAYGWSKLGGECAVRTYTDSLIIRGALCVTPYPHEEAFTDIIKNPIYQDEAAGIIIKLMDRTGVINLGSEEAVSLYDFARQTRPDVRPAASPPEYQPRRSTVCTDRLHRELGS